jgi:hypothetical protein
MPEIMIVPPKLEKFTVTVQGTSSLITHRFSERAIGAILDKQMKRAKVAKEAKNPDADFEDSIYRMDDGRAGIPASGLKNCLVSACRFLDKSVPMTLVRGVVHVDADDLVPIEGPDPRMRRDIVRVGMGAADVRFRAEWLVWAIDIPLIINADVMSIEQVVNLLQLAGFSVGLGEWRPEKDGSHGRFVVGDVAAR